MPCRERRGDTRRSCARHRHENPAQVCQAPARKPGEVVPGTRGSSRGGGSPPSREGGLMDTPPLIAHPVCACTPRENALPAFRSGGMRGTEWCAAALRHHEGPAEQVEAHGVQSARERGTSADALTRSFRALARRLRVRVAHAVGSSCRPPHTPQAPQPSRGGGSPPSREGRPHGHAASRFPSGLGTHWAQPAFPVFSSRVSQGWGLPSLREGAVAPSKKRRGGVSRLHPASRGSPR